MVEVKRLPEFDEWFASIKDKTVRIRLDRRLDKVQRGIFGDVKHLQDDILLIAQEDKKNLNYSDHK